MSAPLSPGHIETKRFPVVGERQPSADLITQGRRFYKSVKWVRRVVVLAEDRLRGADVTGARFDGSWGLTESQEDYLASRT